MRCFQRACVYLRTKHLTQMSPLLTVAPAFTIQKSKNIQFLGNSIFCTIEVPALWLILILAMKTVSSKTFFLYNGLH